MAEEAQALSENEKVKQKELMQEICKDLNQRMLFKKVAFEELVVTVTKLKAIDYIELQNLLDWPRAEKIMQERVEQDEEAE